MNFISNILINSLKEKKKDFEVRYDDHGVGQVLILKGGWSGEILNFMRKKGIYALRISNSKSIDISFLSQLNFLRSLEIYCWDVKGVKVIEHLPQLEVLGLQCKSSQKIDFSSFTKLRVAMITWSKGLNSLMELSSIEHINITNYPYQNLEPISSMVKLKALYLTSRKLESLKGIEVMTKLELLDLYNCPFLTTLAGKESCLKLKTIEIEACNRISV